VLNRNISSAVPILRCEWGTPLHTIHYTREERIDSLTVGCDPAFASVRFRCLLPAMMVTTNSSISSHSHIFTAAPPPSPHIPVMISCLIGSITLRGPLKPQPVAWIGISSLFYKVHQLIQVLEDDERRVRKQGVQFTTR